MIQDSGITGKFANKSLDDITFEGGLSYVLTIKSRQSKMVNFLWFETHKHCHIYLPQILQIFSQHAMPFMFALM